MDDDCMLWTGGTTPNGYGTMPYKRQDGKWSSRVAHRAIYIAEKGEISEGAVLDHLCRNRLCINSDHLEPVTNQENLRRGVFSRRESKTCGRGHEFTAENTYWTKQKARRCRKCASIASNERYHREYYPGKYSKNNRQIYL